MDLVAIIIKKPCHFGVVSYKRRRWAEKFTRLGRAASLIEKETDEVSYERFKG